MKIQVPIEIHSFEELLTIVANAEAGGHFYGGADQSSPRATLLSRVRQYLADAGTPVDLIDLDDELATSNAIAIARKLWRK